MVKEINYFCDVCNEETEVKDYELCEHCHEKAEGLKEYQFTIKGRAIAGYIFITSVFWITVIVIGGLFKIYS